ncbi:MAG: sigma-70 family RNA polymerase sigma factor [Chloroflexi bacterium]|nr:sigma-70 family RNA polymerase sigma factor [Chloroflexota bacterium]MBV9898656.1 sigma-70 family RNA polymerase sigma factor [Chloroflexota bacterium]
MTGQALAISTTRFEVYTGVTVELGLTLGGSGPKASARAAFDATRDEDTLLVDQIARGDARALERIYDRHSRGVYSVALRLLTDTAAAEEVVQETFLKLWRQPGAYQPSRGRLLPWLLGVAHHHAVDMLRRRQLEQRHRASAAAASANGDGLAEVLDNLGVASSEEDPQLRAGSFDQIAGISRALAQLPVEQRLPLELAYYRGMTQYEVATLLGVPLGTIKTRMRLGLQQLRTMPELAVLWSER